MQDGEQKLFHLSKKTIHDLDRLCKEAGVTREPDERITDTVVYRYRDNAGLSHLERALFRYPVQEYKGTQDSIHLFEASAPKEELRQVCLEIRRLVREKKYCYRDIAVVTGDLERYGFLAREMFGRFDIPYYLDQTNKLVLNPLIEFIRSALLVVIQEYSYEAVFHFLRCGMAGVTPDGQTGWRTTASRWEYGAKGMAEKSLPDARRSRRRLRQGLMSSTPSASRLSDVRAASCRKKSERKATGKELVKALYAFIVNASIEEKLEAYEQYFTEQGELVKEQRSMPRFTGLSWSS